MRESMAGEGWTKGTGRVAESLAEVETTKSEQCGVGGEREEGGLREEYCTRAARA